MSDAERAEKEAEKLFPGQTNWKAIFVKGFLSGCQYKNNDHYKNKLDNEMKKIMQEIKELREYRETMEDALYDPEKLADLLGGL